MNHAGHLHQLPPDDSDVAAGRLADDLSEIFGRELIFRDVDTLEPGEDSLPSSLFGAPSGDPKLRGKAIRRPNRI